MVRRADRDASHGMPAGMIFTADLWWLFALSVVGALLLLAYLELALAIFRAPELSKRMHWIGLVVPGAAIVLAIHIKRRRRLGLFALLLVGYVALRVAAP